MKTGPHPVVRRAQLDGLAAKHERVRQGLELARRRGGDLKALLYKMSIAVTMACASLIKSGTFFGSFRVTMARLIPFGVLMRPRWLGR
jgi:hypothetical protein